MRSATAVDRLRAARERSESTARPFTRLISNIYFMMFTWQIFSPTYFGVTIYLECFVALLNPDFWVWLLNVKLKRTAVAAFVILCATYLFVDPPSALASVFTAITVLYLVYAFETRTFYLYRYLLVSIGVAIAQYYLIQHHPAQALRIGPTALAKDVWGAHATATYSNFYAVVGNVTRVSGLSREAGFFASLLIEAICLYALTKGRSKLLYIVFAAAFYISLSKMSFVIVALVLVVRYRKRLARIPWPPVLAAWLIGTYLVVSAQRDWLLDPSRGTYLVRFGASLQYPYMTVHQWLVGTPMSAIASPFTKHFTAIGIDGKGVPGFIVAEGLIVFGAYLLFWACAGIRTPGVLFLCLGSLNETFRTCQNYVSLAYFFAFYLLPGLAVAKARGVRLSPRGLLNGSLVGATGEGEPVGTPPTASRSPRPPRVVPARGPARGPASGRV